MANTNMRDTRIRARFLWLGLLILVTLTATILVAMPSRGQSRRGRPGAFVGPQPVQATAAVRGNIPITLSALGTVTPLSSVTVLTQISGQLTRLGFTEGQMVSKGEFLAQIDPRPYHVALEQAEGQFTRDQALLQQAKGDLARYQKLEIGHYVSAQQIADQLSLVQQYQGSVQSDQAQIDSAKLNLSYCHIVAPVSGRVGLRQVSPGNYLTAASPNGIVVITELSPISVLFSLPEDDVPQVMQQVTAGAQLQATVYDRTNTNELAVGSLTAVDNLVNTSTGTVQLRAVFKNADNRLFPNEFVNVQLLVNTLKSTIVVPVAAVQRGVPGTFVYIVNANDTVSLRKVALGPTAGDRVAVLSGLNPGEQVVTDGAEQLRDGAKVMLPKLRTAASGTAVSGTAQRSPSAKYQGRRHRRTSAPAAGTH